MNKKIKVIDLVNMQYKNEKMPKNIRIKYSFVFDYYTYNEEIKWYETADKTSILDVFQKLDYEVEILEDNTEQIEGIELIGTNFMDMDKNQLKDEINKNRIFINKLRQEIFELRKDKNND